MTNQKQELPVAAMFVNVSGRNEQSLQRTYHISFLPSFGSFGQVVSEEKFFQKSTIQKQELPVAAMFVNELGRSEQSLQRTFHTFFLPDFGSFGQAVSEENMFQNSTNQKQELHVVAMLANRSGRNEQSSQMLPTKFRWQPCLLTDRDEMSNLHRGHSIDDSYQVSVVAMFVNRSGRNEQSPQMLPTKFRFIWPSGFRGEFFFKLVNQK